MLAGQVREELVCTKLEQGSGWGRISGLKIANFYPTTLGILGSSPSKGYPPRENDMRFIEMLRSVFHRVGTQAEFHSLETKAEADRLLLVTKIEALESRVFAEGEHFKAELAAKEYQIAALESKFAAELASHLEALNFLEQTKRSGPGLGDRYIKPALLK